MKKYLVISGSGPDRVGLVDEISAYLSSHKLNIEDSRMAVLGGEFALILLVSGEEKDINWLKKHFAELASRTGLKLSSRDTIAPTQRALKQIIPYQMTVSGMDHPGIVREFTAILHKYTINIESMETKLSPAPLSGTPIFKLECKLAIPAEVKIGKLKAELSRTAEQDNLDLDFEPL